ncbi:hypothetical protein A3715_00700 [Oleiphilus sp. HI0009]|nr:MULTISPECIES: EF-P lysine aminoacylase EpmA [unclassified Oleiphilus]KZX82305.1 hypothetical protein A3715_00700 [Oleiphilus sp. HI0009]KZY66674.1 hypothetical protein A3738_05770 [Oleiphilus sp. HI0066]KZY73129.1 hypothetical protein A3739_03090 [Oleiphilus sp. HI0067]
MWQPSCSHTAIKARAELYAQLRAFFSARNVLEVDTPLMSVSGSTDPHLASYRASGNQDAHQSLNFFLQTSPEFAMKRLLASGLGDIYQLCKSFREAEQGGRHNPEFTMLEWYRVGFSLTELMEEIADLVCEQLSLERPIVYTYREVFLKYLEIDPFSAELSELQALCSSQAGLAEVETPDRDACLDLLISVCIEPKLGFDRPCFLTDYPASQASLARIEVDSFGNRVGKRAELYVNGIELANAYDELVDASEQEARFIEDRRARHELKLANVPYDKNLVSALASGLPECSGVALGVDRLLMLKLKVSSIQEVLSFPIDRA